MTSKYELIKQAVNGEKCERLPFTFWTHLPGYDNDPIRLAQATNDFYKHYDIDLIKTMNNGMYQCEDYGVIVDSSKVSSGGVSKAIDIPIQTLQDFEKIEVLKLEKAKALCRELESLAKTIELVKNENVPVIFTCFSPLTVLSKLTNNKIFDYINQDRAGVVKQALQNLTLTEIELVKKAREIGANGIYFATQLANYNLCSEDIYKEYGMTYDLQIIQASQGEFDTIHCHGDNIMYDLLKQYPINIFNWHAYESKPTLLQAKEMNKCLMTGLVRQDITDANENNVAKQIDQAIKDLQGYHHILSPGCVIRYPINEEILLFIKNYLSNIKL